MGNVIQFKAPYKTLTRRLRELEDKRYPSLDSYIAAFDKELRCCGWTESELLDQINKDWSPSWIPNLRNFGPFKKNRILH